MDSQKHRQIKKPRLSLSCNVCRRRKVRCGREQPKCTNCVRMKENCVYKAMIHEESGHLQPVSPQRVSNGPNARPELSRSHWRAEAESATYPEHLRPGSSNQTLSPKSLQQSEVFSIVSSWEEVIQPPKVHPSASQSSTATTRDPSPVQSMPPFTNGDPLGHDHLSLRRGSRSRYIGRTFWGFIAGKKGLSDNFFDENLHAHPDLPLPHISSMGMFNLLRSLPTKPVADTLLKMFFIAVWPILPLLHPPDLQEEYCRNSEKSLPSKNLLDDPTFICLLFAVLYCGASATPAARWMQANLEGLQKSTTVSQLKSAYTTSLYMCQHLEHPTMNTLTSTLLTSPFMDRPIESLCNLVQVSTTLRIAQTMGLHREGLWSALSPIDQEIRRRVWWHIIWLDVQSSVSTGLAPCCGNEALDSVRMVGTYNEGTSDHPDYLTPSDPVSNGQSVAILFAIGRYEAASIQARVISYLQSVKGPTHNGFKDLITDSKQLMQKIDSLIARIPTQGIPERGYIPSLLANLSPYTHPFLYNDDSNQPNVFAACARIMLTLLKFEIAILLIVQLCVNYLRIYLQFYQAPAFSPYVWFCCSHFGPLQCVFLTLMYLHSFQDTKDTLLARYCIDEVIYHCVSTYQALDSSSRGNSVGNEPNEDKLRTPIAIQALVHLQEQLHSSLGLEDRLPAPLPYDLNECKAQFSMAHLAIKASDLRATLNPVTPEASSITITDSSHACGTPQILTESLLPISGSKLGPSNDVLVAENEHGFDIETWSSSLIVESDNILAHPDDLASDPPVITSVHAGLPEGLFPA
ncbi:hypothetical protein N7495_006252 [Penicillium taxi]|uniref:uncharacterized protein n=1 Tax=Penicillium taxi TaxID=168475 RepID=UPI0025452401|nr:uncharacterized protein N7495_006252 [Penicillium taxi]KAJ5894561.1 hypothetical protein N7495_006252 [Penicillium taxi]